MPKYWIQAAVPLKSFTTPQKFLLTSDFAAIKGTWHVLHGIREFVAKVTIIIFASDMCKIFYNKIVKMERKKI